MNHLSTDEKTTEAVISVDARSTDLSSYADVTSFKTTWIGSSGRMNCMVLAFSVSMWESIIPVGEWTY